MLWLQLPIPVVPAPALRVGLGPALHLIRVDYLDYDQSDSWSPQLVAQSNDSYPTVGLVIEAMLTVPARTRIFTFLDYKRHEILAVDIGPYGYMDSVSLGASHTMWTWGMGFRLR